MFYTFAIAAIIAGGNLDLQNCKTLTFTIFYFFTLSIEAEHGYASVLPYDSDFPAKKTKSSPIRKTQNNR